MKYVHILNERLDEIEDALISAHDEIAELDDLVERLTDEYAEIEIEIIDIETKETDE